MSPGAVGVASTGASVASTGVRVALMGASVASTGVRVALMGASVASTGVRVASMDASVALLDGSVASTDVRVARTDVPVELTCPPLARSDGRFDATEGPVAFVEADLGRTNAEIHRRSMDLPLTRPPITHLPCPPTPERKLAYDTTDGRRGSSEAQSARRAGVRFLIWGGRWPRRRPGSGPNPQLRRPSPSLAARPRSRNGRRPSGRVRCSSQQRPRSGTRMRA
jgi:hypothetical protein